MNKFLNSIGRVCPCLEDNFNFFHFLEKLKVVSNFTQSLPLAPSMNVDDLVYTQEKKIENCSALPLHVSLETLP